MTVPSSVIIPRTAFPLPREALAQFCTRWNVSELSLFGSALRDDFRPDSDVDVMVVFDVSARPSLFDLAGMREELEGLFGRKVDLVTRAGVVGMENAQRRDAILRSAQVVHAQ